MRFVSKNLIDVITIARMAHRPRSLHVRATARSGLSLLLHVCCQLSNEAAYNEEQLTSPCGQFFDCHVAPAACLAESTHALQAALLQ